MFGLAAHKKPLTFFSPSEKFINIKTANLPCIVRVVNFNMITKVPERAQFVPNSKVLGRNSGNVEVSSTPGIIRILDMLLGL